MLISGHWWWRTKMLDSRQLSIFAHFTIRCRYLVTNDLLLIEDKVVIDVCVYMSVFTGINAVCLLCVCVCRWGFWVASSGLDQQLVNRAWQSTAHNHCTVPVPSPKVSTGLPPDWKWDFDAVLTYISFSFICQVSSVIVNVLDNLAPSAFENMKE